MFENLNIFKKEKKIQDVYGVINERTNKYNKDILFTIPKLASLFIRVSKLKREGKKDESVEREMFGIVKKFLPAIIDVTHYSFELFKQVEYNYGNEKLLEYVKNSGKDPLEFAYNYNKNKEGTMKLLALLAVLKKEGLTMEELSNPEIALKVMNGESQLDILARKCENFSAESINAIDEILDKETKYSELNPNTKELAEKYHFEYMSKNIYPYVKDTYNSVSHDEERVLKLASKFGNKRNSVFTK